MEWKPTRYNQGSRPEATVILLGCVASFEEAYWDPVGVMAGLGAAVVRNPPGLPVGFEFGYMRLGSSRAYVDGVLGDVSRKVDVEEYLAGVRYAFGTAK